MRKGSVQSRRNCRRKGTEARMSMVYLGSLSTSVIPEQSLWSGKGKKIYVGMMSGLTYLYGNDVVMVETNHDSCTCAQK